MDTYKTQPGWLKVATETFVVGSYTVVLFVLLQQVFYSSDWNLFLFVLGFLKHLFGYLLGIQKFYCRYGYACQNIKPKNKQNIKNNVDYVLEKTVESILEGIAFVVVGNSVLLSTKINKIYVVFATGCLLHIMGEISGVHKFYCENGCSSSRR